MATEPLTSERLCAQHDNLPLLETNGKQALIWAMSD
jgi:hypothetical protein